MSSSKDVQDYWEFPQAKLLFFLRAFFDAAEVEIIQRNVEKVTTMPRKVYDSLMLNDLSHLWLHTENQI